jgi:hypothetical protein
LVGLKIAYKTNLRLPHQYTLITALKIDRIEQSCLSAELFGFLMHEFRRTRRDQH